MMHALSLSFRRISILLRSTWFIWNAFTGSARLYAIRRAITAAKLSAGDDINIRF
jgi:hypothetical protein